MKVHQGDWIHEQIFEINIMIDNYKWQPFNNVSDN